MNKPIDRHLLQRRRLLWYLGLGVLGTGTAATLRPQASEIASEIASEAAKLAGRDLSTAPSNAPITGTASALPIRMPLPAFQGISQWLNSESLTVADLKGSVVLIQFWTFACINCQRTLPYITGWHQQYAAQGLKVIGVHTPEFAFEREVNNIEAALTDYQIDYPVPVDNDFKTWRAYENRFWPHLFLADRNGMVRYDHIGEGAYDETERTIRQLLA